MASEVPAVDIDGLNAARFREEFVAAARPVVLRNLVADWPLVLAGRGGSGALAAYLGQCEPDAKVSVRIAPAETRGQLFYDATLDAFNYRKVEMRLADALDRLMANAALSDGESLAIQSVQAWRLFPRFAELNPVPLLPPNAAPRLWIGNAVTVAAHYDPMDNLACVAVGRRRFTLFPPDQVANLYPGPFEQTPAGAIVSMVDFDAPDLERYPGFVRAMEAALIAELAPGDALFIPCLWWHHVRSTEPVNLLVNYWWQGLDGRQTPAMPALLHAMLAIKHLPEPQRAAWRALFDHYVFAQNGPPGEHLPPARRGIQGEISAEMADKTRAAIARALAQPASPSPIRRATGLARRALRRLRRP